MAVNKEASEDTLEHEDKPDTGREENFPIVGIGASAGGLHALETFFDHLPDDPGMAFVVVQHLAPDHESQLAQILQSHTSLEVQQVSESMALRPNCVFVIPPDRNLAVENSTLHLSEMEAVRRERAPIDHFFRSLAEVHGERALGIILSGTGSGETQGIKRIKERGGVTMAQESEEAEHGSMARSAIATSLVDIVAPVAELAEKLIDLRESAGRIELPEQPEALPEDGTDALHKIFAQLRSKTGHDFAHHKRSSVLRRIRRRMQVHRIEHLSAYLDYLRRHPEEVRLLFQDLLISVTNFFRDREAFEMLEEDVIPTLFEDKVASDQVRVWVPGCATAEEAYSVAILLREYATAHTDVPDLQVFATDIDENALSLGRKAFYPSSIEADVSEERLRRFFTKETNGYRVTSDLRDIVLFTRHNVLNDPPFPKLDLITCRNLLIYLKRDMQERLYKLFHYALNPGGYLFLGTSESADGTSNLFTTVHKKHRIYRRRAAASVHDQIPILPMESTNHRRSVEAERGEKKQGFSFGTLHQRLVEQYAPPSLVVNEDHELVHLSEGADRYLQFPGGEPSQNILDVVRPSLRAELRTALYRVVQTGKPTETGRVRIEIDGELRPVQLIVRPAEKGTDAQGFVLIIFDEQEEQTEDEAGAAPEDVSQSVVDELQEELRETRERLQSTIEEHETSREEMKASNEELQSMNEELKSTTEELETSKEELQSMNEELTTVNQELQNKNEELTAANDDLRNLMASTQIATVFLDRDLHLKRYTPTAERVFNVMTSDVGRPFEHVTHKLAYDHLAEDAECVLDTLEPIEREIRTRQAEGEKEKWFLVRFRPYRTAEEKIEGVVITFVDITERRKVEEALRRSEEKYRLIVNSTEDYAIFMLDPEGQVASWNAGAEAILGYEADDIIGQSARVLFVPEDRDAGLFEEKLTEARTEGRTSHDHWLIRKDGQRFWGSGAMTTLHTEEGELRGFVKILRDLTEQKMAEEALRRSEEKYRLLIENMEEYAIFTLDTGGHVTSWNPGARDVLGYEEEEILGKPAALLFTEEDRAAGVPEHEMETAIEDGHANDDRWQRRKDGSHFWASGILTTLHTEEGELRGFVKILRDLTERKRLQDELEARAEERAKELHESEAREQAMLDALPDIVLRLSKDGVVEDAHVPDPGKLVIPIDEMMGQPVLEVLPDRVANPLEDAFSTVLETGKQTSAEFTVCTQDGQERTFEVRLAPANDGVLVVKRDVTERRQLEREVLEASEREYRRIAQELHDDLGQRLMGAQFLSRSLRRQLEKDESPHVGGVKEITGEINEAIDYVRDMSHGLAAVDMSEGRGLDEVLRSLAEHIERTFDVKCVYESEGPDQEGQTTATHLYRIAQEAVTNAIRHGDADEVRIRHLAGEEGFMLRIEDNGSGIPEEVLDGGGGLGLRSMRYRANLIQCRLSIRRRSEEGGTVVSCTRGRR